MLSLACFGKSAVARDLARPNKNDMFVAGYNLIETDLKDG